MNTSNQDTKKQDDVWLFKLFKDVSIILSTDPSDVDWTLSSDYKVMSQFLINDIQEIQEKLKDADDKYLYYVCRHIFNVLSWMRLIATSGFPPNIEDIFGHLFEEKFGDKYILQNIYDTSFERWVSQKTEQQQVGENFYNILEGKLYYRNRFGKWFEVDRATAFDLEPNKKLVENNNIISQLDSAYKETCYDSILRRWEEKQYKGVLPDNFLQFDDKETSPEAYFDFSIKHAKTLLENPVSITELERWNGGKILNLEHIVKISSVVLDMVKRRRKDNSHNVYLLRDCLMFYEMHKIIDILESESTSVDQLLIGRKLLSHKLREWGYYVVMLEILYTAHERYPTDFSEFYNEFTRLMDMFVSLNPGFATVVADLADYIKNHIQTDKNKITIFDIGFQGSINLLTKYIIDSHIGPSGPNSKIETGVKVGVGAEWSKKLFGNRYESYKFSFLNHLQSAARSDELYHYKLGSLNSGKIRVVMGDKEWQHKATIELVVLVIVTILAHTD